MVARVLVAVLAVAIMGWLAVLLRNEHRSEAAVQRIFDTPGLSDRDFRGELRILETSRTLDPDPKADVNRAGLLVQRRRFTEAAAVAEHVLAEERDNYAAWSLLERATRDRDPARAAAARAQLMRLNPLARPSAPSRSARSAASTSGAPGPVP